MVQIGYAFETINISLQGGGVNKDVAEELINGKIAAEGWETVKTDVIHSNKNGDMVMSVVVMYTLTKNVEETTSKKK